MSAVFVAGHKGLVGSAICRRLRETGIEPLVADRSELDLTDQHSVDQWFEGHGVDQVYLAAAKVGGILANDSYPAEFIRDNFSPPPRWGGSTPTTPIRPILSISTW